MDLFKNNCSLYFLLFLLIVIFTSEASEKQSNPHHHHHHHHHHDQDHTPSKSGFMAQRMCEIYTKKACNAEMSPRRMIPSQKSFHIINGVPTLPKQYPYMALIGYPRYGEIRYDCGGTLISENFVMSAAHCDRDYYGTLAELVRLGELDFASSADDATPVDYKITKMFLHPDYEATTSLNDIALFKFKGLSKFTTYIRPVCLNTLEKIPNQKFIALGWGEMHTGARSTRLLSVELDQQNKAKCSYYGYNDKKMLCAGYAPGGKDTCRGDSGGPLLTFSNQIECSHVPIFTQIGITSYGDTLCGTPDIPAVYTRVSYFIPWIEKIVWNVKN